MSRAFPVNLVLESLRPGLVVSWANFCERAGYAEQAIPAGWEPEFAAEVARVWAASDFVAQSCVRDPELMERLRGSAHFLSPRPPGSLAEELAESLSQVNDEAQLASALRKFRRQEMCRIAWRDIAGRATLDETLEDLSELADRALSEALVRLDEWQRRTWGAPTNEAGEVQTFCVLAMGKLGARELNFSSDIDLVFVYDEEGETDGARPRSNAEFFTRIGQALIRVIDAITADGFVFRVDMRLRPNGDSGPLVLPIDAFENYYAQSGRDWERYAMIKVRAVAGDLSLGERLIDLLKPFVYRRYLDFNAIDSLRDMKRMIASQALRRGAADDVKLGAGGIRDIEFTAQSLQLVWGGRHPALRTRGVREALSALGDLQFLDVDDVRRLLEAYEFHRRLENRLQAIDDRQTQRLPADDIPQARLATAMGVSDYSTLYAQWESYREIVAEAFARLVTADATPADDPAEEAKVLLWADALTGDEALDVLGTVVLKDPAAALKRLEQFKTSAAVRSLSEAGRNRLDRLMPLVLSDIAPTPDPAKTLHQALSLLEAIVRRTTYVSLLVENPEARRELITLIGASPWIAALLSRQPVLLDELLDPQSTSAEISTDGLRTDLARRLNAVEGGDVEQEMEALRAYKGAQVLHVAAAEVTGRKRLMRVSDTLTEIAEVALDSALSLSWRDISLKWGEPRCTDSEQQVRTPAFGIIGYGKLGGLELGYGSDLDLVFLHDSAGSAQFTDGEKSIDNSVFFARVGQRILHYLGTRTPGGVAYEVDMRLRPSGNKGMLVATLQAYEQYQREEAWTWEHQALVRARFIAGPAQLGERFALLRHDILSRPRDISALRKEVMQMRERMVRALDAPAGFDLKQSRGGMIDIEFLAQFGVLAWAAQHPQLTDWADNVRIFEGFAAADLMPEAQTRTLVDAYLALRGENHRLALLDESTVLAPDAFTDIRSAVSAIWDEYLGKD